MHFFQPLPVETLCGCILRMHFVDAFFLEKCIRRVRDISVRMHFCRKNASAEMHPQRVSQEGAEKNASASTTPAPPQAPALSHSKEKTWASNHYTDYITILYQYHYHYH